jgi:hypothetical protein
VRVAALEHYRLRVRAYTSSSLCGFRQPSEFAGQDLRGDEIRQCRGHQILRDVDGYGIADHLLGVRRGPSERIRWWKTLPRRELSDGKGPKQKIEAPAFPMRIDHNGLRIVFGPFIRGDRHDDRLEQPDERVGSNRG